MHRNRLRLRRPERYRRSRLSMHPPLLSAFDTELGCACLWGLTVSEDNRLRLTTALESRPQRDGNKRESEILR
jgi:hypothetical protein